MKSFPTLPLLLEGKTAIVTGGAGAIGKAVARGLASHGAAVAVADLDEATCIAVAEEISAETGGTLIGVGLNVTEKATLEAAAKRTESELGVANVIAVNAGVLLAETALQTSQVDFERVLEINLTGSLLTAQVFGQRMSDTGVSGSIIFTSSLFGVRGGRGNSAYSASKFGIIGLAQTMAAELAPMGIRVNSVCPGQIQSEMIDGLFEIQAHDKGTTPEHERAAFEQKIPMGRLGTTAEVANGFVYLASDLSSYVTGHALLIDGGWQVG